MPIGGYAPKGFKAEDGQVPARYGLTEHEQYGYPARTEANVVFSNATIIFHVGKLERGSKLTKEFCLQHNRKHLVVNLDAGDGAAIGDVTHFLLVVLGIAILDPNFTLNIAGNRESVAPGIQLRVKAILVAVLRAIGPALQPHKPNTELADKIIAQLEKPMGAPDSPVLQDLDLAGLGAPPPGAEIDVFALEDLLITPEQWDTEVPLIVRKLANAIGSDGTSVGIGRDDASLGWFILATQGQGPCLAWAQRHPLL